MKPPTMTTRPAPQWLADAVRELAKLATTREVRDYVLCVRCDGRAELQSVSHEGYYVGGLVRIDTTERGGVVVTEDCMAVLVDGGHG